MTLVTSAVFLTETHALAIDFDSIRIGCNDFMSPLSSGQRGLQEKKIKFFPLVYTLVVSGEIWGIYRLLKAVNLRRTYEVS